MKRHNVVHPGNFRRMGAIFLKMMPGLLLRTYERKKYRTRIRDMKKRTDPVFVIGHWRSGTSYLQFLLSKDPQFVWHDKYQGLFPDIYLSTSNSLRLIAERFLNMFRAVSEWKKNISLDMDIDSPIEIESAYVNAGLPETYHWGHVFPKAWEEYSNKFLFMRDLSPAELEEWKKAMQFACKKIRYHKLDARVLVKNPGDTARIRHILEVYPEAKFIFIHRNPYDVFYSNKKLWKGILKSIALQDLSENEVEDLILWTYEQLMTSYLEQRQLVPKSQLIEVSLQSLNTDPERCLKNIYDRLNLGSFGKVRSKMIRYFRRAQPQKSNGYQYDTRDVQRINRRWSFSFEEWNYQKQFSRESSYQTV